MKGDVREFKLILAAVDALSLKVCALERRAEPEIVFARPR